jgi:ribosome maturation factor RimP
MGARRPFFVKGAVLPDVYTRERELEREISRQVEEAMPNVEVLAVEFSGPERFTVFIDHPSGVDHALCERVTNVLRSYLDRYTVDVSSPGIERPLRKPAHFRNVIGRKVSIRTAREIAGRKRFKGVVEAVNDHALALAAGGGERMDIPYDAIVRGNLIDEG